MDMAAVSVHGALPVGDAPDEGESRVKDGQAQDQERHRKGDDRIELEETLDGHGGQDISQERGAGVTHEDLGRVEVIGHETHAGTHQGGHHQRHLALAAKQRNDEHRGGGNGGNAVGQTVQSVNEVHRVGDGHDPDHRHGD